MFALREATRAALRRAELHVEPPEHFAVLRQHVAAVGDDGDALAAQVQLRLYVLNILIGVNAHIAHQRRVDGFAGGVEDVAGDGEGLAQRRVQTALGKGLRPVKEVRRAAALGTLAEKDERAARL